MRLLEVVCDTGPEHAGLPRVTVEGRSWLVGCVVRAPDGSLYVTESA